MMNIFHFFEIYRFRNDSLCPSQELKTIVIELILNKKRQVVLTDEKQILILELFSSMYSMNIQVYLSRKFNGKYIFVAKCDGENKYSNFSEELTQKEIISITERND